ncbi:DNA-binding Xre family transcriptional regulator [Rhizobium leguminosarum]|uniref:DNA-binding Xre family transcriptional regulator n=1 Tax=Rhizobium leguminosarum TaxID=384 RepID=A0AAE2SUF6_RHILE|nr:MULTISPECIES: helix-turn-helix transcriptional regulator [Rhizobium]MBB4288566.1 DNA-binding Xre family transcriptional regulator [Rhizobium leguminosarum]MBB4295341.1 DNA-binding Xre family transcriptional regulator [Rhizobium leguminosarum]MBB4306734.1 DNA-binding Xre family transcriptional regulator [Rhizobium leguminosarum]MBB4417684.1 DNA-binding Xre family transcriptional regulator [Rhizobium leguminosarum]MBB4432529.1 DNA-binding Xre family transcriptional regulator [Rhizobium espera
MGEIQTLTIDGKGYVLLSEEDYRDLVDLSEARAAKARIDAGEETWPEDVVKALISGEDPVRVFRKHRGISVKELAEKAGLSQPYLSEIETGKKEGSLDALKAIARILDVDLDDLV